MPLTGREALLIPTISLKWADVSRALSIAAVIISGTAVTLPEPYLKPVVALGISLNAAAIVAVTKEVAVINGANEQTKKLLEETKNG